MSSRLRRRNDKLFEVIVEAVRGELPENVSGDARFQFVYPKVDQEVLNSVIKFVFPFDATYSSPSVDSFTFVLTDIDGKFKFGFCRLSAGSNTCHCLVSYHPWFDVFYQLLNRFVDLKKSRDAPFVTEWIDSLLKIEHLDPGTTVWNLNHENAFKFEVPDPGHLMTIPGSRNLMEYYCAVDIHVMIEIFASTILERRILVTSKKLSRLTACIHCAASFLFPFHWQHVFIPILPVHLLDYCSAPMPFLIGVHSSLWNSIDKNDLSEVLILDADDGKILSQSNDLNEFPSHVISRLKKNLKTSRQARSKTTSLSGDEIPRAFLRALVMLFGGYRTAMKLENGEIVFDEETFIKSRPEAFQPFLKTALQLQVFQQFIDERLLLISSNPGFVDTFELEVICMEQKFKQKKNKKFDLKLFTKRLIKMDVSSSGISKEKNITIQTPIFSKQMFRTSPRKMSIQYPNGGTKEKSKKLLSLSNSSDHLDQHIKMTETNKIIQEMPDEVEQRRKMLTIRDELCWSDPASSSSSSDTLYLASQESLDHYLNASKEFNRSFNEAVSIPSLMSTDYNVTLLSDDNNHNIAGINDSTSLSANMFHVFNKQNNGISNASNIIERKPSKQANINVQQLIKMYEKNGKEKENIVSWTSPYPGTYFLPGHTPSSIAERQAKLQTSTEQWKQKFRSRNIADVTMDISVKMKKLPEVSELEQLCAKSTLKNLQKTNSCQKDSNQILKSRDDEDFTRYSATVSTKTETADSAEMNKGSSQILRGLSHSGLSRRSAFKVHQSQSSSESQRDSVLQMYKRSLKNSVEENQQANQKQTSPVNDEFTTPPLSSSPLPSTGDCLNALSIADFRSSGQILFKGSISPTSTVSSYSSFVSLEEGTSASNFSPNDFSKNIL